MVGIVDEALASGGDDRLKISSYKDALTDFIKRTDPEIFKDLIQKKKVKEYVESFKNKRKDSNEYIKAVHFLKTYFDDSNKKTIDL